jgi:hypothetical protein
MNPAVTRIRLARIALRQSPGAAASGRMALAALDAAEDEIARLVLELDRMIDRVVEQAMEIAAMKEGA